MVVVGGLALLSEVTIGLCESQRKWREERVPSRGSGKKRVPGYRVPSSRAVERKSQRERATTRWTGAPGHRDTHLPAGVRDLATGLADWIRASVSKQGCRTGAVKFLARVGGALDLPFKLMTSLIVAVVCKGMCVVCGGSTRGREKVLRRNEEAPCGALIRACGPWRDGLGERHRVVADINSVVCAMPETASHQVTRRCRARSQ